MYGVEAKLGRVSRSRLWGTYLWQASARTEEWQVETTYEFCPWEDLVREDLRAPVRRQVSRAVRTFWLYLSSGAMRRFFEARWQFGAFVLYPFAMAILFVAVALAAGGAAGVGLASLGFPWHVVGLAVLTVSALTCNQLFRRLSRPLYVGYLAVDFAEAAEYAAGRRPDWEERLDRLAQRIAQVSLEDGVDEILVVGHSSGAFLAADAVDRAMRLEPKLGRIGPRLSLLTLGSVMPLVSYLPEADWFREALLRLSTSDRLTWLEYQARKDVMSVHRCDPVASSGVRVPDGERTNPTVVSIQLRSILKPSTYKALSGRFFKLHFLYLAAAEKPCHFDYHMLTLGPVPLALRARFGEEAFAALLPDRRAAAWARLERTAHEV
ncbi:putative integral membrane protein [Lutibaculum baratangense AMV1]|uniref:Putative integral membrane protein n=1 Tax=Lutibaculum baratangense AMV1 TaxID=631454 RepID=V4RHB2_9HYPH|nr:putative integral membrane protein [Lutibaculum baratangense AMV1]